MFDSRLKIDSFLFRIKKNPQANKKWEVHFLKVGILMCTYHKTWNIVISKIYDILTQMIILSNGVEYDSQPELGAF